MTGIVADLVEMGGCGINQKGSMENIPLALTQAAGGHGAVVEAMLEREDVDPSKAGEDSPAPLVLAACDGQVGLVKLLLGWDDVDPEKPELSGHTPLLEVTFYGHEGVVKLHLKRDDISPNKPDIHDETPLWWAAAKGTREWWNQYSVE